MPGREAGDRTNGPSAGVAEGLRVVSSGHYPHANQLRLEVLSLSAGVAVLFLSSFKTGGG